MNKALRWFFVGGAFFFLYFYMPEALKDNKVTVNEILFIGINVISMLINLSNIFDYTKGNTDE